MEERKIRNDLKEEEVMYLVTQYLSQGPLTQTYQTMVRELEEKKMIPNRLNWNGQPVAQNYQQYSQSLSHVPADQLKRILAQLVNIVKQKENMATAPKSLLSTKLTESACGDVSKVPPKLKNLISRRTGQTSLMRWGQGSPVNSVHALMAREKIGATLGAERLHSDFYSKRLKLAKRTVGHLSAVYCALYDMTGKYIFTGADDKLVKVWSAVDGRLIATLRGSTGEITDMAVSYENTLLAVGSNDKTIRIWSLPNCASLAVLNAHSGQITSVFFCPMPSSLCSIKYLASTATDGSCAFWAYSENPGEAAVFQPKPTLYQERMRPGHAHILCASFSPGGVFMAAGSADNNVRVYYLLNPEGPQRILEVECHKDRVDSISWAHKGMRFVSGSKDGTALIYRYEYQNWRYTRINCSKGMPGEPPVIIEDPKRRPRVTMVAWNKDDTFVVTATSDYLVKVWNSRTGGIIRTLKCHTEEVYILEPHPLHPNYICTAGHDGLIVIWDIKSDQSTECEAVKVFQHMNTIEGAGHGSIFDCKFSPDGLGLAATDSHGHVLIFGYGVDDPTVKSKYDKLPSELFFHTDYRPIVSSITTPEVLDDQSDTLTHEMPPPFLVDMEGNPYPPELQRLVPGRERFREEQLIPAVVVYPGGRREVVAGIDRERSNIDNMIEELVRSRQNAEQLPDGGYRLGDGQERPQVIVPPAPPREAEPEAVVSSDQAPTNQERSSNPKPRVLVPSLAKGVLKVSELQRLQDGEEEEHYYQHHKNLVPPHNMQQTHPLVSPTESPSSRYGRVRRPRRVEPVMYFQPGFVDMEEDDIEGVVRPNPPQMEISVSQESPRRPVRNLNFQNSGPRPQRRNRFNVRRMLDENGIEEADHLPSPEESGNSDSENLSELSSGSSSESEEESDEDWAQGQRNRDTGQSETNGRPQRKRTRRQVSSSSEGEQEGAPSARPAKVRRRATADENPHTDEPQPGPSSEVTSVKTEKGKTKKQKRVVADQGGFEEIPVPYRPPEWLSEVYPKRSPYFPQLGDELVYCRQGHQLYVDHVKKEHLYELKKKALKQLPYVVNPDLPTEVPARLVKVEFLLGPPRLVHLKLDVMDWESGEPTGDSLTVSYHDIPSVPDFLILRQTYDRSVRHRWNPGDKFRSMIDTNWWIGSVIDHWPLDEKFKDSKYSSYTIQWDSEANTDRLSPWDMEIIPDDFDIPAVVKDGIPAPIEDIQTSLYEARPQDWEPHGLQDAECARIKRLMESVMGLAIAEPFLTPVDLNCYPDYALNIAYLVDLSTIKSRLENLFYRRSKSILTDIEHLALNAEKYNQPGTKIVIFAKVLRDILTEIVNNQNLTEESINQLKNIYMERYQRELKAKVEKKSKRKNGGSSHSSNGSSHEEHNSETEEISTNSNGPSTSNGIRQPSTRLALQRDQRVRPGSTRLLRHNENRYNSSDWRIQCRTLWQLLWDHEDAIHFRHPVDLREYDDYLNFVDTPMSLSVIDEELRGGNYSSPEEFNKDVKLIFENSKAYNTDGKSQIRCMTLRLQNYYESEFKLLWACYKRNQSKKGTQRSTSKRYSSEGASRHNSNQPGTSSSFSSSRTSARSISAKTRQSEPTSSVTRGSSSPRKGLSRLAAQRNPYIGIKSNGIAGTSSSRRSLDQETTNAANSGSSRSPRRSKEFVQVSSRGRVIHRRTFNDSSSEDERPGPSSSAPKPKPQRVRRRISSGESNTSNINGRDTQTACSGKSLNSNGMASQIEAERMGRYSLRNKDRSNQSDQSPPGMSNSSQRSLRRRGVRKNLKESSDDESYEEDEEKENNPLGNAGDSNESDADDDDVEMPNIKEECDEDFDLGHSDHDGEDDDDSEFEGDEDARSSSHVSTPESSLRRSGRNRFKVKSESPGGSDEEFNPGVTTGRSGRRATRNKGKSNTSYAECSDSD